MSAPGYQLIGQQSAGVGGYGEFYGGPYGGVGHPVFTVPLLYLGSDDLSKRVRTREVGPQHERHGIIVARRTWAEVGLWHVVHLGLTESQGLELKTYYSAGTFRLLPDGDPAGTVRVVTWVGREFALKQTRGSLYTIEYDLEEKP